MSELREKIYAYSKSMDLGAKVTDIEKKFDISDRSSNDHLKALYGKGKLLRERISGTGFTYYHPKKAKEVIEAKAEAKAVQAAKNRAVSNQCSKRARLERQERSSETYWTATYALYKFFSGFEGQYPERAE